MLNKKLTISFFIILLTPLFFSACSVTPQQGNASDASSKVEYSTTYTEALKAMGNGNTTQARDLLRDVINKQPNFSNAHVNLGIVFLKNNSLYEAENSFLHAIRINPKNIFAFNQLGILYRQQGKFSKAKTSYEKAIDIDSNYAFAHLNLGILYDLYLYDFSNAIEQYKTYLSNISTKDKQVDKWIIDLERRLKKSQAKKQP